MRRWASFLAFLLTAGAAVAQTPGQPFGGDDAGCTPDTLEHLHCADRIADAFVRLIITVTTCHLSLADYRLKDTYFDEEECEQHFADRFDTALAKLAPLCSPAQLDASTSYRDTLLAPFTNPDSLDHLNGDVYCDSTTGLPLRDSSDEPFVDDAGYLPPSAAVLRHEDRLGYQLASLAGHLIRCHRKLADSRFFGASFDEEQCETAALARFNAWVDSSTARGSWASCLSNAALKAVGADRVSRFDAANDGIYPCP